MHFIEIVNHETTRGNLLKNLGEEFINNLDVDNVLIAENILGKPRLIHVIGELPGIGINVTALFGQRNPLKTTLNDPTPIFVQNLDDTSEWNNDSLLQALDAKAFICLPILLKEDVNSSVLIIKREPFEQLNDEDKSLYSLVARQASITLEHLHLLGETTRRLHELDQLLEFSRKLDTLDPLIFYSHC
jgi:GAF domain-containing protein